MEKNLRLFFALLLTLNIFTLSNAYSDDESSIEYAQSEFGTTDEVAPVEGAAEEEEEVVVDEEEASSEVVEEHY